VDELILRYLHAYGPATAANFARWLAAPNGWAAQRFAGLGDRIEPVDFEGSPAYVCAGDTGVDGEPEGVRLLPYFDAYQVGCWPRELLFPGRAGERGLTRGQAGNLPVLLIAGTVAGVWHLRRAGRRATITVEPVSRLTRALRLAIDDQVTRIGEILDVRPEWTVGQVTSGPHA
jgi:hypothetical protein